jgi:dsRNA-specific ribonuclease
VVEETEEYKDVLLSKSVSTMRVQIFENSPFQPERIELENLPSPHPEQALKSAKLSSLHARLILPSSFSIHTLARCLVDITADQDTRFNNSSLAILGADFTGYHVAEHLICHFPRLPMEVLFEAQKAYIGPESMANITREWGVDPVTAPGGEVDPGLLQFAQKLNRQPTHEPSYFQKKREAARDLVDPDKLIPTPARQARHLPSISDRILRMNMFGEDKTEMKKMKDDKGNRITTLEHASSNFVNAVVGGLILHSGKASAKTFISQHILSRKLDISPLFSYIYPIKDLKLLCRREGFEQPIARLISETGRQSSHPVFIVGIFSGRDKLGEGAGGSIREATWRAATASLKSWYLYSPLEVTLPSETEDKGSDKKWIPNLIDQGEIYR